MGESLHMKIYDKLLKPISEVNYLRAENVARYRVIIRYFFKEHENINYWLHKEDVYDTLKSFEIFSDYTIDKCQSDLAMLVEWGNLTAMQDSSKVTTVEDFKNKKFRYQLSEYTVEIERMTLKLENLEIEGASLEPTLLERIYHQVRELTNMKQQSASEIHNWWKTLNGDFERLNRDYQDYIKTLNSAKAEEMMKSTEFLIFKDKLVLYLRTFVKSLQEYGSMIEEYLKIVEPDDIQFIFDQVLEHERSIPRLDTQINEEEMMSRNIGRWKSLNKWFVGTNGDNEINRLYDITNEIIRKITRYALQIGEYHNQGANRKEEYKNISQIFKQCNDLNEAHMMSAFVFGVDTCLHLFNINERETDSIDSGVYEETATYMDLETKSRVAKLKTKRKPAIDYSLEKEMVRLELEAKMERNKQLLKALIKDNTITFEELPPINSASRKILLQWLSKGLFNSNHKAKTDEGITFRIDSENADRNCVVHCSDGDFTMPCFKIHFEEEIK